MLSKVLGGLKPDITPAQVVAIMLAGIPITANLLRAFGLYDLSPEQQQALGDAVQWAGIAAVGLFFSDAGLRAARGHADAQITAAALAPAQAGAPEPQGGPVDAELPPPGPVEDGIAEEEAELLNADDLVSDEEEFAAAPVQPSQDAPVDGEGP